MDNTTLWFFGVYVVGTIFGYVWGYKKGVIAAAESCIDALIAQGVIKTSTNAAGEIQIHKYDE